MQSYIFCVHFYILCAKCVQFCARCVQYFLSCVLYLIIYLITIYKIVCSRVQSCAITLSRAHVRIVTLSSQLLFKVVFKIVSKVVIKFNQKKGPTLTCQISDGKIQVQISYNLISQTYPARYASGYTLPPPFSLLLP